MLTPSTSGNSEWSIFQPDFYKIAATYESLSGALRLTLCPSCLYSLGPTHRPLIVRSLPFLVFFQFLGSGLRVRPEESIYGLQSPTRIYWLEVRIVVEISILQLRATDCLPCIAILRSPAHWSRRIGLEIFQSMELFVLECVII